VCALLACLGASVAAMGQAQEAAALADSTLAAEPAGDVADTTVTLIPGDEAVSEVVARRHPYRFGLTARGMRQFAIHVVKNEEYNVNDLTTKEWAFDGGVRWFAMDGVAINARYMRGGLGISDRPSDLARFDDLDGSEFIKLDGFVFSLNTYVGNKLFPRSRINPYLVFCASRIDWAFTRGGRDGEPYTILEKPLEGTDLGLGGGIGLEYPLPPSGLLLEFEWTWHYVMTEDDQMGTLDDIWTNTQFWLAGFGIAWHF
jgi:hypothetical protein